MVLIAMKYNQLSHIVFPGKQVTLDLTIIIALLLPRKCYNSPQGPYIFRPWV